MTFGYDALGRLVSQTNPAGTVGATSDLTGRRTRITWPDTHYADYDYLVTGEMEKVRYDGATSGANVLATYGYDQLGRRTSLTRGNGTSTSYAYDAVSRLNSLSHDLAGTTHDVSYGYAYNHAGQIVSVTRSNPGSGPGQADLYAWTKHGSGTTSTTSNGLNQIASWNATVTHDAKGNITSDGTNSYSYSSENLMTGVTVPPWGSDTIGYDPLMRVRGSGTASQQRFLRFQDDLLAEYYGTTLVERFIPGAGEDETLSSPGSSGARNWLYADERGSTIAVAGDAGTATGIYAYDEYGRPGTNAPPRIGYTGQMLFITDQVYDYKNRMYHPGLGRFMQTDPIGYDAGMNLYAYVGGDPVNLVDPLGLADKEKGDKEADWGEAIVTGIKNARAGVVALGGGGKRGLSSPAMWAPYDGPPLPGNPGQCLNPECDYVAVTARGNGHNVFYFNGKRWTRDAYYRQSKYSLAFDWATGLVFTGPMWIIALDEVGVWEGAEYAIGKIRIAPWGNRTGHRYGRWPHYHRKAPGEGQGIGRHRPWETKKTDTSFRDRF